MADRMGTCHKQPAFTHPSSSHPSIHPAHPERVPANVPGSGLRTERREPHDSLLQREAQKSGHRKLLPVQSGA